MKDDKEKNKKQRERRKRTPARRKPEHERILPFKEKRLENLIQKLEQLIESGQLSEEEIAIAERKKEAAIQQYKSFKDISKIEEEGRKTAEKYLKFNALSLNDPLGTLMTMASNIIGGSIKRNVDKLEKEREEQFNKFLEKINELSNEVGKITNDLKKKEQLLKDSKLKIEEVKKAPQTKETKSDVKIEKPSPVVSKESTILSIPKKELIEEEAKPKEKTAIKEKPAIKFEEAKKTIDTIKSDLKPQKDNKELLDNVLKTINDFLEKRDPSLLSEETLEKIRSIDKNFSKTVEEIKKLRDKILLKTEQPVEPEIKKPEPQTVAEKKEGTECCEELKDIINSKSDLLITEVKKLYDLLKIQFDKENLEKIKKRDLEDTKEFGGIFAPVIRNESGGAVTSQDIQKIVATVSESSRGAGGSGGGVGLGTKIAIGAGGVGIGGAILAKTTLKDRFQTFKEKVSSPFAKLKEKISSPLAKLKDKFLKSAPVPEAAPPPPAGNIPVPPGGAPPGTPPATPPGAPPGTPPATPPGTPPPSPTAGRLSKLIKVGKVLGRLSGIPYIIGQISEGIKRKDPAGKIAAKTIGGALGMYGGGALGSLLGGVGGFAGAIGGTWIGENLGERIYESLFGKKTSPVGPVVEPEAPTRRRRPKIDISKMTNIAKAAFSVGITEGGYDRNTGELKTDSINTQSQAAGIFQFLPGTALEVVKNLDDENLKEKFKDVLQATPSDLRTKEKREEVAKIVASLSAEEQMKMYNKFIEPLVNKVGAENITPELLKAYGFAPVILNKKDEDVIYSKGSPAYEQNQFLDLDKSGDITKAEILEASKNIIRRGQREYTRRFGQMPEPAPPQAQPPAQPPPPAPPQTVLAQATPPITRQTAELVRNTEQRRELERGPIVAVNAPQTTNIMTEQGGRSGSRANQVPVRNIDPTYQRALEKTYFS